MLDEIVEKLDRWWGVLFRAIFIAAVGFGGYWMIDPPSIADRPLASLTLGDLASNIFAWGLALGCVSWFFSFPSENDGLSYEQWGAFGGYTVLVVALIWIIVGS